MAKKDKNTIRYEKGDMHFFTVADAMQYGVEKAVIINHFRFWLRKNLAGNRNIKDGKVWTYASVSLLNGLFPYLPEGSISRWIIELEKQNVLCSKNFNRTKFDRTKWYSLNEPEFTAIPQNGESNNSKWSEELGPIPQNGEWNSQNGEPIPDIETDERVFISSPNNENKRAGAGESNPVPNWVTKEWPVPRKHPKGRAGAVPAWEDALNDHRNGNPSALKEYYERFGGDIDFRNMPARDGTWPNLDPITEKVLQDLKAPERRFVGLAYASGKVVEEWIWVLPWNQLIEADEEKLRALSKTLYFNQDYKDIILKLINPF